MLFSMFELQPVFRSLVLVKSQGYRLGMFELQRFRIILVRHEMPVIAWACLSCNQSKLAMHSKCEVGYRLGMFELQLKARYGFQSRTELSYRLGMFELQHKPFRRLENSTAIVIAWACLSCNSNNSKLDNTPKIALSLGHV